MPSGTKAGRGPSSARGPRSHVRAIRYDGWRRARSRLMNSTGRGVKDAPQSAAVDELTTARGLCAVDLWGEDMRYHSARAYA